MPLPTYPFRRDRHGVGAGRGPVEPAGPAVSGTAAADVEETVADLWRQLLGVTSVGPADDFFELGGDSLVGIQLLTRVRREFGIRLSPAELFDHPLLGDFTAEVVRRTTGDSTDGSLAGLLAELEGLSDAEVNVLLATPSTKEGGHA
jgi:acyl carrier protein